MFVRGLPCVPGMQDPYVPPSGDFEIDGNLYVHPSVNQGTRKVVRVEGAANTANTLSTEYIDVDLNLARTVQWATGSLTTQRAAVVQAPTYAFVGASTITNAATLAVTGGPTAGTNATITTSMAFWVQAGRVQIGTPIAPTTSPFFPEFYDFVQVVNGTTNQGMLIACSTASGSNAQVFYGAIASANDSVAGFTCTADAMEGSFYADAGDSIIYLHSAGAQNGFGFDVNGSIIGYATATGWTLTTPTISSGVGANTLAVSPGAMSGITAGSEVSDVIFSLSHTIQHETGAMPQQRAVLISAPTYSFVGASTITAAATVAIIAAPIAGTNATITNSYALWIQGGATKFDGTVNIRPVAGTGAQTAAFTVQQPVHTALTASAEFRSVSFEFGAGSLQHATGAITTQRAMVVDAPIYSFVGASTITNAATVAITDAPTAGTNATITNSYAFWVQAGATKFEGAVTVAPAVNATGRIVALFTAAANTANTLSTEFIDMHFNSGRTVQWSTGALTTQRFNLFSAPTIGFVGASTVTNAATVAITNSPQAGTNATLTNSYAFWVQAGVSRFDGSVSLGSGASLTMVSGTLTITSGSAVLTSGNLTLTSGNATLSSGYIDMVEIAAPGSPSANTGRLYVRDNGSGTPLNTTQLVMKWPDGTISVIAESPPA